MRLQQEVERLHAIAQSQESQLRQSTVDHQKSQDDVKQELKKEIKSLKKLMMQKEEEFEEMQKDLEHKYSQMLTEIESESNQKSVGLKKDH